MRTTPVILIILASLAGLLLLVVLLLFAARVRAVVTYTVADGLRAKISLLSFKILGTEEDGGEGRVRVSDYSLGRIDRRGRKKKKAKGGKPAEKAPKKGDEPELPGVIKTLRTVLSIFFGPYAKYISVRAVRLNIAVAAGDAAGTAILWGVVIQGVAYILELLNQLTDLQSLRRSEVNIYPDYTADAFSADIKIVLKIPVWRAIGLLLHHMTLLFEENNKSTAKGN